MAASQKRKLEPLYTVKEVADMRLLGLAHRAIRTLIKNGELRVEKRQTKDMKKPRIYIPESAIVEYLDEHNKPYHGEKK